MRSKTLTSPDFDPLTSESSPPETQITIADSSPDLSQASTATETVAQPLEVLAPSADTLQEYLPEIPHHKGRWLIVISFTGINLLLLVRTVFDPSVGKPIPFQFPKHIDLATAILVREEAFTDDPSTRIPSQVRANTAHRYIYQIKESQNKDKREVTVDVRYLIRTTGNVPVLSVDYGKIKLKDDDLQKDLRFVPNIGHYTFFQTNDRAYLSACINPRGITTVTTEQFDENLSAFAMKPEVLTGWLLGQTDIKDRRCLWTQVSMTLDTTTVQDAQALERTHDQLKAVWLDWRQWWQNRFPKG
ncbi:MAG: cyanoexosortase A system-associated protein [Pseudanabaena sp. ELA607]